MANPTTNYSWVLPTSSDLVKDLPADFDVALQGVDTRLKALQPGTTLGDLAYSSATANTNTRLPIGTNGQILTVVGGVPAWSSESGDISSVTAGTGITGGGTSGDVTITNAMATAITTNGDLIYGTGSGTFTRRGIGTTGQVLAVSGGVPTWTTISAGSLTQLATGSLSGASVSISSISGSYRNLWLVVTGFTPATNDSALNGRVNNDSSAAYTNRGSGSTTDYSVNNTSWNNLSLGAKNNSESAPSLCVFQFLEYASTSANKFVLKNSFTKNGTTTGWNWSDGFAQWNSTSAITSIQLFPSSGNFSSGTYTLYGVN